MPPKKKTAAAPKAVATKVTAASKRAAAARKEASAEPEKPAAAPKKTAAPKKAASEKPAPAKAAPKKRNATEEPEVNGATEVPTATRRKPAFAATKKQNTTVPVLASEKATSVEPKKKPETKKAAETKKVAAPKKAAAPKPAAAPKKVGKKGAASAEPVSNKEASDPKVPKDVAPISSPTKRKRTPAREPTPDADSEVDEPAKEDEEDARPVKRVRTAAPISKVKLGAKINSAPETVLDVFVFGEGSSGELGLGNMRHEGKKPLDVKRPRINHNLTAATVGVVQIACGGMHVVALTKDNKILTWGVNDQGALGRDTTWDGGLRDADAEDSDSEDDDDSGLSPKESIPAEIDMSDVAEGTRFVQVVASDSASFALTEDGRVYGWGTFRASDGILGFTPTVKIQKTPGLLAEPKKVVQLAAGSNHVMALDKAGKILTWGCPEQNQLGRRCVQRDVLASALRPGGLGLKRSIKITKISCGSYHSFALDSEGIVYAWGLNNFGELAIEQGAGDSDAAVLSATRIEALEEYKIADICGGEHHSVACTTDGRLLTWGRIDGHQVGLPNGAFNEDNAIYDEAKRPRILKVPTVVPDLKNIVSVAAGTDNSFALTGDGKTYSWGFSTNYQTGLGTSDDVEVPTLIENTAVKDRKITFAGAGGQYSIIASPADS
ncbi:RCC1 domain-containing protein [Gaeumannomyces tritici R3-111a-1]|uniref:RCC1 domain-containing protein n=1 Tax=Gaeumannomyces tritici (strain R3-111a-1) TaxID=644352 RepID=J3NR75_GAET3|nr:RCC1 domain-containing protein [Gaeumannomyces tritici R3-111a-1]EJT78681.1 RCC1 domain-containing protein [Gaeumannomyces tritici R3-111a-1]